MDLHAGELRRDGEKIKVPDQSLKVLAMLLEHPGEVVTREELRRRLWPNGTIVEFDHSINAAIKRLRQALEDSADGPQFIETLPRRGYRFLAPVERAGSAETLLPSGPEPDSGELVGQTISRYRVLRKLGQGAMGVVYEAEDTRLGRSVALKFLPEHLSDDPRALDRFEREARVASALNHPNICTIYEVDEHEGRRFIVMEYLAGKSLDHLVGFLELTTKEVLTYAVQIADALAKAHSVGIIHRDHKPSNIMVGQDGLIKLLDFGLAKVRAPQPIAGRTLHAETPPLTSEGAILGTLQYMAPEQLEGLEADARTDIFALGAVIYEMLTGRKAFEGKSQASLIAAILERDPLPLSTHHARAETATLQALDHVIRACLAKDPDARWQTAHDVLVELKWIAANGTLSPVAVPAAMARPRKGERLGWIVAGCLLIVSIATFAIVSRRPPDARVVQFDVARPQSGLYASISPDGRYVAYVASTTSWPSVIFLHSLNASATNPLPGTEGVEDFGWSPDSRQIAFSTASGIKRISIMGGSPQTICNRQARGITWNRDGVIVFSPGNDEPSFEWPLYEVDAAGGEPKALTKLERSRQELYHVVPQFLPDGRHFIYLAISARPENSGTYLGSLDSSEIKRIHDGSANVIYAQPGYLIFTRGTSLMAQQFHVRSMEPSGDPVVLADPVTTLGGVSVNGGFQWGIFSVSQNGVLTYLPASGTQLVWFDRSGKRLGTVGEPANYSNPAISPDQKMVAVGRREWGANTRDIWLIDLQRGASSRLTFHPADDTNPTWSPDSRRIAFSSDRKGHRDIYVKAANGVGEELMLAESAEEKSVEDWSADGQYLVWGDATGHEWLFSFRDHKTLPLLQAKFMQDQSRLSPNNGGPPRWIAYSSFESGAEQVYVRSFAGALSGSGSKLQISTDGGFEPMWRGDGKELFYLNRKKLMAVEVNGDGESFRAGTPKELFEARLTPEELRNRYIVTADGKRFLMNVLMEEERASFRVVLNWPALLKH